MNANLEQIPHDKGRRPIIKDFGECLLRTNTVRWSRAIWLDYPRYLKMRNNNDISSFILSFRLLTVCCGVLKVQYKEISDLWFLYTKLSHYESLNESELFFFANSWTYLNKKLFYMLWHKTQSHWSFGIQEKYWKLKFKCYAVQLDFF